MPKITLLEGLNINQEPVVVGFTDQIPEGARRFKEGKRGCIASMLVAVSKKGGSAAFDRNTYGCPGGGIGICFSDSFEKANYTTAYFLARGEESYIQDSKEPPRPMGVGERFFDSMLIARKWMDDLPVVDSGKETVVFEALSEFDRTDADERTLVVLFINANQLAALTSMLGFLDGVGTNIIAPFTSACQHILYAEAESEKPHPKAILGFLDVAQRDQIDPSLMTLTLTFEKYEELERIANESVLITPAWEKIRGR